MAEIPEPTLNPNDLADWYNAVEQLKKVKAKEMSLRKKIFSFYFPDPKEGTNTAPLDNEWVIKGGYNITRDVDEGAFVAMREALTEKGINSDTLVRWKPSLAKTMYNELTAEERTFFDQCLIIKPGSPTLEITKPKARAKAGTKVI